jgi:low temperature requirement protein LtrA
MSFLATQAEFEKPTSPIKRRVRLAAKSTAARDKSRGAFRAPRSELGDLLRQCYPSLRGVSGSLSKSWSPPESEAMSSPHPAKVKADKSLLRTRSGGEHSKVTFIELFFDLVFVFAVTQLSHLLMEHFTPIGAVQTLLLMLAVWWVWIYTSWVTNWLDPEKLPVRFLLLAIMLVGLVMSSSLPMAFESRGIAFATAYVLIQVGRTVFFLWAVKGHPGLVRNFQRILVWLIFGGMFWIAGAFAQESARLAFWVLALGLEYMSPSLGFWVPGLGRSTTSDWNVEGGHIAERCALFIIIALGESILVTGATFSGLEWTLPILAAFVVCFAGSLAMWWLYFDASAETGSETISRSGDPGKLARLSYTYVHLFIVAGIIISAVADEFVMAHPLGHTEKKTAIAILGSTAIFLVGTLLFRWTISRRVPLSHLTGIAILALLVPAGAHLPPLILAMVATMVLVFVAAWERRARHPALESSLDRA